MIKLGNIVIFKSAEPFYSKEKSGAKANTERILSYEEWDWLLNKEEPKITKIRIESSNMKKTSDVADEYFQRDLTDISEIGELLGSKIVVFSWKHKKNE